MAENRLDLLLMIHIYNVEHDQIQIKLIVNEFIHPELLPLSYINFEHLFAIITDLLLLLNQSSLCSIPIPSEAIRNSYRFLIIPGSIERKTLEKIG